MADCWWEGLGDYILGLDLGPSSIGWAIIECDAEGRARRVVRAGVRRFEAGVLGDIEGGRDESRATARRDARGPRRQHWRRQWRARKVFRILTAHGLLPACEDDSADARHRHLQAVDGQLRTELMPRQDRAAAHVFPYYLRARALEERLPLHAIGRAFYHLAQRRGFLSNRKTARDDEESGKVKAGISQLEEEMSHAGARTLGQYFSMLDPEEYRIRARWTSRKMYRDEFEAIWSNQAPYHPELTSELKERLSEAIFHQRPLKSQRGLIGKCDLEPQRRRAPLRCLLAQRFRILQRINDLRVTAPDGEIRPLTAEERQRLYAALDEQAEMSWAAVKRLLGMKRSREYERHWVFNFEEGGDKRLIGNRTAAKVKAALGEAWAALTAHDRQRLIDDILSYESEEGLAKRLQRHWGLPPTVAKAASDLVFEQGFAAHSRKAIAALLPLMEQGKSYSTARKERYGESLLASVEYDSLPPIKPTNRDRLGALPQLRNPAVERTLSELRKVVNAILRRCGRKPKFIRVELARDLKHGRRRRRAMIERRDRNTKAIADAAARILREMGQRYVTAQNILKVRLAEECGWQCPFTGRSISMDSLVVDHPQFDVEHIIPFSRSLDNSFVNKTLCYHEENRNRKRGRTPWEAYHGTAAWDEIIQRVKHFRGDVSGKKLALFLTETLPNRNEFTEKQLSDTRYVSRLASEYLGLLYGGKVDRQGTLRVQVSPGRATAYLRQRWNLNSILGHPDVKDRADHRHHAIDAIVIALTDVRSLGRLADAAKEAEDRRDSRLFADVGLPFDSLVSEARTAVERIRVSSRVSRKLNGPLHQDSIFSKPRQMMQGNGQTKLVHCVRKRLDAMSPQDVDAIVDDRVRELVKARLRSAGGTPQQVFKDPGNHPHFVTKDGRIVPIHKARIRKPDRPIAVGDGSRRRYVNPGSNHHMEIVAVLDAAGNVRRWKGVPVSRFDAVARHQRGEEVIRRDHGPGKRFLFSLAGGEHVELEIPGEGACLARVTVISEGQIELVRHADARPIAVRKKTKGARLRFSPDALRKAGARKVVVDPLGEVIAAGD